MLSTRDVAIRLGVKPATLGSAVWGGRIPAPQRGPGGAFCWTDEDVDRARSYFRMTGTGRVEGNIRGMGR